MDQASQLNGSARSYAAPLLLAIADLVARWKHLPSIPCRYLDCSLSALLIAYLLRALGNNSQFCEQVDEDYLPLEEEAVHEGNGEPGLDEDNGHISEADVGGDGDDKNDGSVSPRLIACLLRVLGNDSRFCEQVDESDVTVEAEAVHEGHDESEPDEDTGHISEADVGGDGDDEDDGSDEDDGDSCWEDDKHSDGEENGDDDGDEAAEDEDSEKEADDEDESSEEADDEKEEDLTT